jgi:flagellar assembly protein FliH
MPGNAGFAEMQIQIRPMQYPVLGGDAVPTAGGRVEAPDGRLQELEGALAERDVQRAREVEAARREGLEKGRAAAAAEQQARLQGALENLAGAVEEFRAGRDEYLARVENEVVRLALAIAERIIHREAQMDPLLLSGAVRVALGQLADTTQVRLRVPAADAGLWTEMVRLIPGLAVRPEVVADAGMQGEEAVLESAVGSVDLGVRAQLTEIERGFFDLLDARRENAPAGKQG